MAKSVNSDPVQLKNVRLSFPVLKEATRFDPDNEKENPKFRAAFILDPSDETHAEIIKQCKEQIRKTIVEMWGKKPDSLKPIDCMGDGNNKRKQDTDEIYEGYEGMFYIQANNTRRPILVHRDKTPVDKTEVEDVFYGGCYVDASINFWAQDNKFGKAIRCNLRIVRFRRDGEAFGGGGVNVDEEMDDFDDMEDAVVAETDFDENLGI